MCDYIGGSLFVEIYTNQDFYGCGEGVDAVMPDLQKCGGLGEGKFCHSI